MIISNIKKYKYYLEVDIFNNIYNIENELIIKYQISVGKDFSYELWTKILDENEYLYFDRISKNKLSRLTTKFELESFLIKNNARQIVIDTLILKYLKYNFLNDDYYTKEYIAQRINNKGPKVLKNNLLDKGIDLELINQHLNLVDERIYITNIVSNYLNKEQKKNKTQTINYLLNHLINKGYSYSLAKSIVYDKIHHVKFDEDKLIEKDFNKIYEKTKRKYQDNELFYQIKTKLLQKGYNIESVNFILNQNLK